MDVKTCYCPHQACSKYGIQGQGSHIVHKGFIMGHALFDFDGTISLIRPCPLCSPMLKYLLCASIAGEWDDGH